MHFFFLIKKALILAPLLLFAVVIAISINADLPLVIAEAVPVLAICMYVNLHKGFPYFERMQKKLDKVNAVVQEKLVNNRIVKSFVR